MWARWIGVMALWTLPIAFLCAPETRGEPSLSAHRALLYSRMIAATLRWAFSKKMMGIQQEDMGDALAEVVWAIPTNVAGMFTYLGE